MNTARDGARSVFITGASSGLGRQMAIEFAQRGYRLALTARRLDELQALASELQVGGMPAEHLFVARLDVNDEHEVERVFTAAGEALGGIDIAVVNAGIGSHGRVGTLPFGRVRDTINTNVIGFMACAEAALRHFKAQKRGQLVGISSVAAFRGMPSGSVYGASKAAVTNYLEAVRCEMRGSGICVTTLSPGFIDTPLNRGAKSRPFVIPVEQGGRLLADLIERRVQTATVPRWPWALVARLIRWLPDAVIARLR
jgi:NAD(P)-dependent dehydrogenase (short-subunit alcohol dehydrogenase family)